MGKVINIDRVRQKKKNNAAEEALSISSRMEHIRVSLNKINKLMSELKKISQDTESKQDQRL